MQTGNQTALRRELTLFDAAAIIIGIMIGSGIFFIPTYVFGRAGAPGLALLVWVAAGVVSVLSGLCYAELGAALPKAGGSYVYLKQAFGPMWAFLNTWTSFLIGGPGSIAALAVAFATYTSFFLSLSALGVKLLAIGAVVFLTAINIIGVRQGALVQRIFTVAKVIPIIVIIVFGLIRGQVGEFTPLLPQAGGGSLVGAFGMAMIAALWAFTGWANVNSVAEELKNPARDLPRAMMLGVGGVTLLYLLFNVALLKVMPMADIVANNRPAAVAATTLFGSIGGAVIAGGALISIFGSTNGCVLAFPRNYFAMARDGLFWGRLAEISPRYGTPVVSLLSSAALSIVLILSGSFDQLTNLVVFSGMIFTTMVVASLFVLRRTMPDLPRPYRVVGYPVVPIVVLLLNLWLLFNTLMEDPRTSLIGLVVPLLGIPVYYWFSRRNAARLNSAAAVLEPGNDD